jgi:hypothetical protein
LLILNALRHHRHAQRAGNTHGPAHQLRRLGIHIHQPGQGFVDFKAVEAKLRK